MMYSCLCDCKSHLCSLFACYWRIAGFSAQPSLVLFVHQLSACSSSFCCQSRYY
ncbi:uncharacterized protein ATC70_004661, partial [Mucor velutinosus]